MASFHKYKKKGTNKDYWEYRILYKDPFSQKFKEKSKKGFSSKSEAKLAAEEMEQLLREGFEQSADESLKSFLETWLNEYKKGTIAKNTFELHKQNIKNHIIPYFNSILLKDIKPVLYQKFINHLAEKGYSRRTIEIKGEKKEKNIRFIESEHISDFLKASYDYGYIYWIFFKTLIETGLRKGEAAGLQWTDIDLKNNTININK